MGTAWSRFRRWTAAGVWARVLAVLQRQADAAGRLDWTTHYVDGTVVRAHQHVNRLKRFRRVATRYETRARHYLAIPAVAALLLWL